MTTEEILQKITSRDTNLVWLSACKVIELSQNREAIQPLIPYLPQINQQTRGLQMGGMLAPNQRFVDFAIRIIQHYKTSTACPRHLYPHYEGYNPANEQGKGNIAIEDTVMEQQWVDYYITRCLACGQHYRVLEREGHYRWWKWQAVKS